jgi:hypothetical protein
MEAYFTPDIYAAAPLPSVCDEPMGNKGNRRYLFRLMTLCTSAATVPSAATTTDASNPEDGGWNSQNPAS